MKLLHYVLIVLNPLFVFGNVDLKQSLLKNLENEDLENIKDNIDNRLMAETFNIYKNGLKSSGGSNKKNEIKMVVDGIVSLINALKRNVKAEKSDKNVDTKDKKKDVAKMVLDDDLVLIYDVESGRLLGRSRISGIENFLTDLTGRFEGTINLTNIVNLNSTLPYGAPYGQYGYPNGQYGAPHGSYGAPYGQYGAPHGPSGAPHGQYGAPHGQYGAPRGQYGAPHSAGDSENYRPHKKDSRDSYKCNSYKCHERY